MCARAPTAPKLADRPMYARPAAEDDVGRRATARGAPSPRRRVRVLRARLAPPFVVASMRASPALARAPPSCFSSRGGGGNVSSVGGGARAPLRPASRALRPLPRIAPVAAIPPNRDWPPADIWEEFRDAVSGAWTGRAVSCAPDGTVPPDADDQPRRWSVRTVADPGTRGGIDAVDALDITTEYHPADTTSPAPPARTLHRSVLGGGQMGKMMIVQGDYADGPVVLPPCEPGAVAVFEFCFSARVPEQPNGPVVLDAGSNAEPKPPPLPSRRLRVRVTVEAAPGEKRNWRAAAFEVARETTSRTGAVAESGDDSNHPNDASYASDDLGGRLGEDDIATGNWRAVGGATFLTCESLMDDVEYKSAWEETQRKEREEAERKEKEEKRARSAVVGGASKSRVGRGRVRRSGSDESEPSTPTQSSEDSKDEPTREDVEPASSPMTRRPRPPPEGLIVVPTWAVKAKAPFSGAHEYLVGGNSPLALLPGRAWALVESMNDELLVEVGVYAGEGGLGEDGGWDPRATEGGASEPRRVMARRYERGGRFASAFFVEESRMTSAELEVERDEGEGGNSLTF